jgi:hypothetical protein
VNGRSQSWRWAWLASAVAHVGFMLLPTPGASRQITSRTTPLELRLAPPDPELVPEPETEAPPEAEPPPARKPAPEPVPAPVNVPGPDRTEPPAPEPRTPAPAPSTSAPKNLDFDLKRRSSGAGGGRGSLVLPTPRLEQRPRLPRGLKRKAGGGFEYRHRGFVAEIARDGTVSFDGRGNIKPTGLGVSFDLTEAVMDASGDDAFHTEKIRFLEKTAYLRADLAKKARQENLLLAQRDVMSRVRSLWSNARIPAEERRRLLFEIWDECAETGPPDVLETSAFLRRSLLAFIRRELPADHPDAFDPDELEALNARRASQTRFEPYGPSDEG